MGFAMQRTDSGGGEWGALTVPPTVCTEAQEALVPSRKADRKAVPLPWLSSEAPPESLPLPPSQEPLGSPSGPELLQ